MDWNLNTHDLDWSWDNIANGGAKGFLAPSLNITRNAETFIHEEKEKEVINKADEDSKQMYSWNGFSSYNFDDGSPAKHLVATSGNSSVENIVSFMQRYPKRCRGSYDIMQNPCCQVEGCNVDLTLAKEYHKRHRICEDHSKTPMVIVAGMERRFCQQCSRFHDLSEFDDKKRSCRRRLSDHNARRRRPSNNGTSSGSSIFNSNSIGKSAFRLKTIRDGGLNESGCDSNSGHAHSLLSMNSLGLNSPIASVTEAHLPVHSVTPNWPHCFNK